MIDVPVTISFSSGLKTQSVLRRERERREREREREREGERGRVAICYLQSRGHVNKRT